MRPPGTSAPCARSSGTRRWPCTRDQAVDASIQAAYAGRASSIAYVTMHGTSYGGAARTAAMSRFASPRRVFATTTYSRASVTLPFHRYTDSAGHRFADAARGPSTRMRGVALAVARSGTITYAMTWPSLLRVAISLRCLRELSAGGMASKLFYR